MEQVRSYWDERPCNVRHSPSVVGSKKYYEEVLQRKYFVEPHIPGFADFPLWKDKEVLEVGCGIGTDTYSFARAGAHVTAIDLSGESIKIARYRAQLYGQDTKFYEGNVEHLCQFLPIYKYDLIYSFGVLHHTEDPARALSQIASYLRTGSELRVMLYHRFSTKVIGITKGRIWRDDLIAKYAEAQLGCPVAYVYSRASAKRLLEEEGFRVYDMKIAHIFPYRIDKYVKYEYEKRWYWKMTPKWLFSMLDRCLGWHLCIKAVKE